MGAIDIIFAIGFMVGIPMYKYWAEQNSMIYIPFVICISCLIVFFMMHFYIYLMISSTNLNMKQIIKNSFYLVSLGIKQSLWSLLASLIVIVMMYLFLPYSLFILPFGSFVHMLRDLLQLLSCYQKTRYPALLRSAW